MKAIVFVNGTVREAVEALAEVRAHVTGEALRAVVTPDRREEFLRVAGLSRSQVLVYRPWLWPVLFLRLLWFLGANRGPQVACLATDHSGGLKLLALALRGRVSLRLPDGKIVVLTLRHFLWLAWQTWGRRTGDICLLGTAAPGQLSLILADLRARYPAARIHALLQPGCANLPVDSAARLGVGSLLAACRRRPRFAGVVIPCAGRGRRALKLLAWLLPLGYREIYNENIDSWPARDLAALLRHMRWRLKNLWLDAVTLLRYVGWRLKNLWLGTGVLARRLFSRSLWFDIPQRVTILGVASPGRLAAIVADARRRHSAPCHGLLPAGLSSTEDLFDSTTRLAFGSPATYRALLALVFGRNRSGYLVFPCTGEGHTLLKCVFSVLPLGRREIYNENQDFCSARDYRVVFRHLAWRLRDGLLALLRGLREWLTRRPNRLTVVGSASGLYLTTIVADLRRNHPGCRIHGVLPRSLVAPVAGLFDSYTVLGLFSARCWADGFSLALGPRRSGYLIIPCTNEGRVGLKLLGLWLPFGLRRIYNENGDSCLVRNLPMMWRHAVWRLHYRIFWQAWSERRGRFWLLHLAHMLIYPARLLAGAALLAVTRWRGRRFDYRAPIATPQSLDAEEIAPDSGSTVGATRLSP